jgi:hypothetical protein
MCLPSAKFLKNTTTHSAPGCTRTGIATDTDFRFTQHPEINLISASSSFHRHPNDISCFLGLLTVCGLGRLTTTTFRNYLSVPSSRVSCNDSERLDRYPDTVIKLTLNSGTDK